MLIKARLVFNLFIDNYVSSFKIMATSTYGSANGGIINSAKMKSVKAITSVVSEKQGDKQNHDQVISILIVVVSSECIVSVCLLR